MRSVATDLDKLLSRGARRGYAALVAPLSLDEQVEEQRRQRDAEEGMVDLPSVHHLPYVGRSAVPTEPPPPASEAAPSPKAKRCCSVCYRPGHYAPKCPYARARAAARR